LASNFFHFAKKLDLGKQNQETKVRSEKKRRKNIYNEGNNKVCNLVLALGH
jgi:hypothetical protein